MKKVKYSVNYFYGEMCIIVYLNVYYENNLSICVFIFNVIFCLLGDSVDIVVYIKLDENGILKEMLIEDCLLEFLWMIIGGKGIMNLFVEVNMNDYLMMFRNFEV